MKNIFVIFLFILLLSCSSSRELDVDVDSFFKKGKIIELNSQNNNFLREVYKINHLPRVSNKNFLDLSISKKKKINGKFKNFFVDQNIIIAITNNAKLILFDKNYKKIIQKTIYKKKIYKNYNLQFSILSYDNKILVSDSIGNIHAFNKKDLKLVWSKKLGVPFRSNIQSFGKSIYLINTNSKIYSINVDDGKINWSFETASKTIKDPNFSYQIKVYNEKLFFTNDSGEIYCLNLIDQNIRWSLVFQSEEFKKTPVLFKASSFIAENNNLFISTNYGFIYSVDSSQGFVNWTKPFPFLSNLKLIGNYLISNTENGLVIIDKKNGNILFNNDFNRILNLKKKKISISDIIITYNNIFLTTSNNLIIKIDRDNLKSYTTKKFNKYIKSELYGNKVFMLNESGINIYQ